MSGGDPLIRVSLPPGWIDLAVGEAHVVRQALQSTYPISTEGLLENCDYQAPTGFPPLVSLLTKKYKSPVIVTAGAKQGLSAVFHTIKKMGVKGVAMRCPYWSQMVPALQEAELPWVTSFDHTIPGYAYLYVGPNNPDGHLLSPEEVGNLAARCRSMKVPFIHDAAYYTEAYTDVSHRVKADFTIYSASKMYGLSGLRAGYVVCPNEEHLRHLCEYVETTTVGVSLLSQRVLYQIMKYEAQHPSAHKEFALLAVASLERAKNLMAECHPDIFIGADQRAVGMFGWYRKGKKFNPVRAKVHVVDGAPFGMKDYVRLNLAVDYKVLYQAVRRLHRVANLPSPTAWVL